MSDEISAEMRRKCSGWAPAAKEGEAKKSAPAKKPAPKNDGGES
jgi:hypothetical protein